MFSLKQMLLQQQKEEHVLCCANSHPFAIRNGWSWRLSAASTLNGINKPKQNKHLVGEWLG